jgi:hypothetical protein
VTDSTGLAFASLALNVSTLALLIKSRVLNPVAVRESIEHATLLMEEMGLDDQQKVAAHGTLSMVLSLIVPSAPFPKEG